MPEVLPANGTTGTDSDLAPNRVMKPCCHFSSIVPLFPVVSARALNTHKRQPASFWAVSEMPCHMVRDTDIWMVCLLTEESVSACIWERHSVWVLYVSVLQSRVTSGWGPVLTTKQVWTVFMISVMGCMGPMHGFIYPTNIINMSQALCWTRTHYLQIVGIQINVIKPWGRQWYASKWWRMECGQVKSHWMYHTFVVSLLWTRRRLDWCDCDLYTLLSARFLSARYFQVLSEYQILLYQTRLTHMSDSRTCCHVTQSTQ